MMFSSRWLGLFRTPVALATMLTLAPSWRPTPADHRRSTTSEPVPPGAATLEGLVVRTGPGRAARPRPRQDRRVFIYTAGKFHRLAGKRWVERRVSGPDSFFVETAWTREFVEPYDRDRDLLVRLRRDYGEWLNREANEWVPWPGSEGRWK